jgi:hypothetical protein
MELDDLIEDLPDVSASDYDEQFQKVKSRASIIYAAFRAYVLALYGVN